MRLSRLSLLFSVALLLIVGINGSIPFLVLSAFDRVEAAQERRVEALRQVDELHRELDTLSRLVRSYTVTGDTRYLSYYYTILAIRDGDLPALTDGEPATFWSRVLAGTTPFEPRHEGPRVSLRARLVLLGFDAAELEALEGVLAEAEAQREFERAVFAAIQGLQEARVAFPVGGSEPRPDLAVKLVHGHDYDVLRARGAMAVEALKHRVDRRTGAEVAAARTGLREWIFAAIAGMAATALLVLRGLRTVRSKVLTPIEDMCAAAGRLACGEYRARAAELAGVAEICTLRNTLNSMAGAIERDIDEREAIGRELVDARARAEQATRAKSMFLANTSHEIRTPLNAVIGMADLLLHSRLPPRQREFASKIRIAGRALLATLNDILDLSKIEAGRLELEVIPFRLEQVLASAFLLVERSALEKGVELIFEARAENSALLDQGFVGDPLRIGQVLANLLSNAVKFTSGGHVSVALAGRAIDDGRYLLELTVEDTGIGMRPEQVEHLFEDFVQADGATTRQYGGSGLGLAIVRRLLEAMGGEVRVHSQPGRGSRFRVCIPLERDGPAVVPAAPESAPALRVLVAEDYPEARLALIDLLQREGIDDVDSVGCGAEIMPALEAACAEGRPYGLMFLDWSLPDRKGGTILKQLCADPALAPPHIALQSMPRTLDEEVPEPRPDCLHFCDKPILPGALRRLCDLALGREPALSPASVFVGATGALDGMRVLLVEDNATSRDVATALLGRWGVEVDTAADGRDALAQLAARAPDYYALVFMDLQMPVMDGYEAIRRIRARPELAALPVYGLSAHSGRMVRARCMAMGMNGCLDKPYELADLFAVLRRHCGGDLMPAAPTPAVAGAVVQGLEGIPGLDPGCAINDTGLSPTLYPRLLGQFRREFADGPQVLRGAVEQRAWEQVALSSHTLKGRAGLLGMGEIAVLAGRLEAAARAADGLRARTVLEELEACLRPLVEGLLRALPADGEDAVGER